MPVDSSAIGFPLGQPIGAHPASDAANKVHFPAGEQTPTRRLSKEKERPRSVNVFDVFHGKSRGGGQKISGEAPPLSPTPEAPESSSHRRPSSKSVDRKPRPSSMHGTGLHEAEPSRKFNELAFKSGSLAAPSVPNIFGIKLYTDEQRKFITRLQDQTIDLYSQNEALKNKHVLLQAEIAAAKDTIAKHEQNMQTLDVALNAAQSERATFKEFNDAYKHSIAELRDCLADAKHASDRGMRVIKRLDQAASSDGMSVNSNDDHASELNASLVGTFGRRTID